MKRFKKSSKLVLGGLLVTAFVAVSGLLGGAFGDASVAEASDPVEQSGENGGSQPGYFDGFGGGGTTTQGSKWSGAD